VLPASDLTMETPQNIPPNENPRAGCCVVLTLTELQMCLRLHDYFFGKFMHNSTTVHD
jgi:hypothetical protein